jgi:hypothetical protein
MVMNTKIDNEFEEMAKQEIEEEMKQEEWPDPIPINSFDNLPEFPVQLLPSPGREMIEAVSEVNQVDKGMPSSIFLAVLSSCLAKKAIVDLITHTEPINLYVASIAEVGERKSRNIHDMTLPIYEYQKQKEIDMKDIITEAYNKRNIEDQRLANLQKIAAKADNEMERKKLQDEATQLAIEIENNPVPKSPIYIADDITSEATAAIMAENDERLSVISAEGNIFGIMAGRYNERGGNFDIYLKAHPGDSWSSHRIGRKQETMLNPALTMCLTVQPDVIQEIGRNSHFRGRGLLARFLYSLCHSKAGTRKRQNKSVSPLLIQQYSNFIKSLMDIPLQSIKLSLTPDAAGCWDQFHDDIEAELIPGRSLETLKDWGSKLPGAVARIAGLLHFAQYGANAVNMPISVNIVSASCAIGLYYKEHALAAFGVMQEDPRIEAAKKILSYIYRHKPETFKGRDVLRHSNLKSMDDVKKGLNVLIERAYIRDISSHHMGKGRPQAIEYEINEKIYLLEKH